MKEITIRPAERIGSAQAKALEAVAAGRVRQCHPMTWVFTLEDMDAGLKHGMMMTLAQRRLIRVVIADAAPGEDYMRRVVLTDTGEQALAAFHNRQALNRNFR